MDDFWGAIIAVLLGIALLVIAVLYALAAVYCVLVALVWLIMALLDGVMSAGVTPEQPAIMWALWGCLLGASLGFWTVAPIYGLRKLRGTIIAVPVTLMLIVALFRAIASAA